MDRRFLDAFYYVLSDQLSKEDKYNDFQPGAIARPYAQLNRFIVGLGSSTVILRTPRTVH